MGYQGNYPPSTPLTSSQIGAGAVDTTALAADAVATVDIANGAVTIPKLSATGTASSSTFLRGDGVWGAAGLAWQSVQTTGFTAVAGRAYPCNTTSAAFTVTLPASPSAGDQITVIDYAATAATNVITISPNGNKINSSTSNAYINTNRGALNLVYIDSTQGWLAYASIYQTNVPQNYTATYLVVAGGAGGGSGSGGGGGAGGYLTSTSTLAIGTTYTITVGAGGAAGTSGGQAANGSNSVFDVITASGGGGGGNFSLTPAGKGKGGGIDGGSGGGGSFIGSGTSGAAGGSGTSGQGYAGGTGWIASDGNGTYAVGAGGGGAGAVGATATNNVAGNGGAGTASSITGSSVTYAGGGGGGVNTNAGGTRGSGGAGGGGAGGNASNASVAGTANTGGGGGGSYSTNNGSNGGSGVVILSVPTTNYSGVTTGSPTVTTSGSNTILTFTASGTYRG